MVERATYSPYIRDNRSVSVFTCQRRPLRQSVWSNTQHTALLFGTINQSQSSPGKEGRCVSQRGGEAGQTLLHCYNYSGLNEFNIDWSQYSPGKDAAAFGSVDESRTNNLGSWRQTPLTAAPGITNTHISLLLCALFVVWQNK